MSDIHRIPASPMGNVPQIRKAKPQAFQRPRIDMDAGRVKRDWRRVQACNLGIGDTIPGLGVITHIDMSFVAEREVPWAVTVYGGEDNCRTFPGTEEVLVFAPEVAE